MTLLFAGFQEADMTMKMFINAKLNTYDPSKVAGFFYLKFLRESCPYLHVIKFQKGRKVVLSL